MRTCTPLLALLALSACPGDEGPPEDTGPASLCAWVARAVPYQPGILGEERGVVQAVPGDIVLANDQIQVVIQAPDRFIAVNPYGGTLLDADIRRDGAFHDALGEVGLFVNLAGTLAATSLDATDADPATGACAASVRAAGPYALSDYINPATGIGALFPGLQTGSLDTPWPLQLAVTYTLQPDAQHVDLEVEITTDGPGATPLALAWLIDAGLVDPWVRKATGFDVPAIASGEYLAFGGDEVAYGLVPLTFERIRGRSILGVAGGYGLTQAIDAATLLGFPDGVDQLLPGETYTARAAFVVAPDLAGVARIAADLLGDPPCEPVTGQVVEEGTGAPLADVRVTASTARDGQPDIDVAPTRTDDAGRFEVCLPPGPHVLLAGAEGRPYAGGGRVPQPVPIDVAPGVAPVTLSLPASGRLDVTVADVTGGPLPSRLTVVGLDPSPPSARLEGDGYDPLPPGVTALLDAPDGRFQAAIEPGTYEVWASRGPEYAATHTTLTVAPGATATWATTLPRVVDTTGFLSGDFHVHAQASPDATVSNEARVVNMAAEGVEILVGTDHAFIVDYAPTIAELGLGAWLRSVPGQEITTFDLGHYCGFPLPVDPTTPNRGAIDWTGLSPTQVVETANARSDQVVVQLNHPRAIPAPGAQADYFTNVDLQFDATGAYAGPRSVDPVVARLQPGAEVLTTSFVAVEVMTWLNVQGLADWTNFLNAGVILTATGNSDTHTTRVESSGWPRNLVRTGIDDPAALTDGALVEALRGGRNVVSFGPFATVRAEGETTGEVGDTIRPRADGSVTVSARVQAPLWSPFDEVELIDGSTGEVIAGGTVDPAVVVTGPGPDAVRLEVVVAADVTPAADAWYIAVVRGTGSLFPVVPYSEADAAALTPEALAAGDLPGHATAFAVTNPVWVDADRDGLYAPSHRVAPRDDGDYRREDRTRPY